MAFLDELAEVPVPNKLMLGWLMEHMSHIIKHVRYMDMLTACIMLAIVVRRGVGVFYST